MKIFCIRPQQIYFALKQLKIHKFFKKKDVEETNLTPIHPWKYFSVGYHQSPASLKHSICLLHLCFPLCHCQMRIYEFKQLLVNVFNSSYNRTPWCFADHAIVVRTVVWTRMVVVNRHRAMTAIKLANRVAKWQIYR